MERKSKLEGLLGLQRACEKLTEQLMMWNEWQNSFLSNVYHGQDAPHQEYVRLDYAKERLDECVEELEEALEESVPHYGPSDVPYEAAVLRIKGALHLFSGEHLNEIAVWLAGEAARELLGLKVTGTFHVEQTHEARHE